MENIQIFPWNDNFETGVPQIDEQHQRLVQLVNLLASHLAYQSDIPTLNKIFDELADYAVYHFQTEEEIWHQYMPSDPLETKHKEMHDNFVNDVTRLRDEENTKPLNAVVEDILLFLTHWLAFHILDSDKRLAKIVLALQSGLSLSIAKSQADQEMSGALKALIQNVLYMYGNLCNSTLQLMKEVVARQKAEAKLRLAANVFNNTHEAICITDAEGNIVDANPPFCQITGYDHDEIISRNLSVLKSGLSEHQASVAIWPIVNTQGHWSGEIWNRTQNGALDAEWLTLSAVKNENEEITNFVGIFSSVGQLIKRQHKLERLANHDALTGLPNRLLLADRLELAMATSERLGEYLAICYLDLDGFKPVNDRHGHAVGDQLLIEISRRLKQTLRSNDTVARVGGDEFVILLGGLHEPDECRVFLDRLLQAVQHPFQVQDGAVQVSASTGVTIFPTDRTEPALLIKHADHALYQAKRSGKSRYHFYRAPI